MMVIGAEILHMVVAGGIWRLDRVRVPNLPVASSSLRFVFARELKKGSCKVTNISVSDTNPPIEVVTTWEGEGDPGYLNTCCELHSLISLLSADEC